MKIRVSVLARQIGVDQTTVARRARKFGLKIIRENKAKNSPIYLSLTDAEQVAASIHQTNQSDDELIPLSNVAITLGKSEASIIKILSKHDEQPIHINKVGNFLIQSQIKKFLD